MRVVVAMWERTAERPGLVDSMNTARKQDMRAEASRRGNALLANPAASMGVRVHAICAWEDYAPKKAKTTRKIAGIARAEAESSGRRADR